MAEYGKGCALIVTDMLNAYDHEDAEPLMESARAVVPVLRGLLADARETELMTVYVNDNHSDWTAGRNELVQAAVGGADASLIEPIVPPDDVPFVVKARHSIFYGTQLEYMLWQAGVSRLILTGQVTEQCILYSALDAYVRHYEVTVVRDAVAHIDSELADAALKMMESNMRAEVLTAGEISERLARG